MAVYYAHTVERIRYKFNIHEFHVYIRLVQYNPTQSCECVPITNVAHLNAQQGIGKSKKSTNNVCTNPNTGVLQQTVYCVKWHLGNPAHTAHCKCTPINGRSNCS